MNKYTALELKAKLLCEGFNADETSARLFAQQNPSGILRGGLSSGGKMHLDNGFFVNAPVYHSTPVALQIRTDPERPFGFILSEEGEFLCRGTILQAPAWYDQRVQDFPITLVMTAHNRQLVTAVYEGCSLSERSEMCKFCVMYRSLPSKNPQLVVKSAELIMKAMQTIPVSDYGGLTINGGMTFSLGNGMELIEPVVRAARGQYPNLPIAIEMAPPEDLDWIDRLTEAGMSSLMMNLECWDPTVRESLIPGKNRRCPREKYLDAFDRAYTVLGAGKVSTCFIVGVEPMDSLKDGIKAAVDHGAVPSPLAGRRFEDIHDYPFQPNVDWREFMDVLRFARTSMFEKGLASCDEAGCVACGMCDLIKDMP
ncbi:MAG: radical SAM protein [Patescibacteria group bacterium]|jgi:biotin synthase-related radical SAM superfamily protein